MAITSAAQVHDECLVYIQKRLFKEKRTRQDVVHRKILNLETSCSVIKTTWNTFCKSAARALDISTVLYNTNKSVVEAYVLANTHVVRMCEEGKTVPELSNVFFYQCLSAVSEGERKKSEIKDLNFRQTVEAYKGWRHPESKLAQCAFLGSGWFQQISQQMAIATKNDTAANFYRRFKRYLKHKYGLDRKTAYLVLKDIYEADYNGNDPLVLRYRQLLPPKPKWGAREDNPELVMPMQYIFLRHFENAGDSQRLFSLLPTKQGFECSHMKMCTNGLQTLMKRSRVDHIDLTEDGIIKVPRDVTKFREYSDKIWRHFFNIGKFETEHRKFAGEILTDGKGVSIVMRKPKADPIAPLRPDVGYFEEFWGLDPGRREIYVASNDAGDVKRCSTKQYYHDASFKRSLQKIDVWQHAEPDVRAADRNMPTKKTTKLAALERYVRYMSQHIDKLLRFQMRRPFRDHKFRRYVLKQKRIREMCLDITAKAGRKTVVGFGDWSNCDNAGIIKKSPAGPVKSLERELRRHCTVISVDEFRTSKTHSSCHHDLETTKRTKLCRDGVTRRVNNYSVLFCPNRSCNGMTVNRDVNASRNILSCLKSELLGIERPPAFRRSSISRHPYVQANTGCSSGRDAVLEIAAGGAGSPPLQALLPDE